MKNFFIAILKSNINNEENISNFIHIFVIIWVFLLIIFILYYIYYIFTTKNTSKVHLKNEIKNLKNVPNFRDIPCNEDIFVAYYLAYNLNLMKKQTDLLEALLLKWLKEEKIAIESVKKKSLFTKKDTIIHLKYGGNFDYSFENELYVLLLSIAVNKTLRLKKFKKWCKKNYSIYLNWFNEVLDSVENNLINNKKMFYTSNRNLFRTSKQYELSTELREEAKQLKGLKEFLIEFTNIKTREAIEVHLFDKYLIYASLFGIADKVAKQFKDLYPDMVQNYDDINLIVSFSSQAFFLINILDYWNHLKKDSLEYSSILVKILPSNKVKHSSSSGGGGSFGGGKGGGGFR